ncbi:unnamed protein product [Haemonchus placei]|uniref:B30.2/SPRY domain-containing protein n=1 Tax=Haemonchus placei TaxID=6290 RepID=A0A0N4X4C7_HAEPC|nr:unnamed protein product [Haemonchus placei]
MLVNRGPPLGDDSSNSNDDDMGEEASNGKQQQKDAASTRADFPIPPQCGVYYFEITIVRGLKGCMGVGVCGKSVNLNRLPGWDRDSYGYHGDDGNFFSSSGNGVSYGPKFTSGDVIGCGVNLVNKTIFFTKNGVHLGIASRELTHIDDLYPTIGLQTTGEVVDANFGQRPFRFDIRPEMEV